jgi:hypothetical protein
MAIPRTPPMGARKSTCIHPAYSPNPQECGSTYVSSTIITMPRTSGGTAPTKNPTIAASRMLDASAWVPACPFHQSDRSIGHGQAHRKRTELCTWQSRRMGVVLIGMVRRIQFTQPPDKFDHEANGATEDCGGDDCTNPSHKSGPGTEQESGEDSHHDPPANRDCPDSRYDEPEGHDARLGVSDIDGDE